MAAECQIKYINKNIIKVVEINNQYMYNIIKMI